MKETFKPINSMEELQDFLKENLLTKLQAAEITGQSLPAFSQSVNLRNIKPFFETEGSTSSKVRLYLKSDMEEYRAKKRRT